MIRKIDAPIFFPWSESMLYFAVLCQFKYFVRNNTNVRPDIEIKFKSWHSIFCFIEQQ